MGNYFNFYIPINVHALYSLFMKIDTRCYGNKVKKCEKLKNKCTRF